MLLLAGAGADAAGADFATVVAVVAADAAAAVAVALLLVCSHCPLRLPLFLSSCPFFFFFRLSLMGKPAFGKHRPASEH